MILLRNRPEHVDWLGTPKGEYRYEYLASIHYNNIALLIMLQSSQYMCEEANFRVQML